MDDADEKRNRPQPLPESEQRTTPWRTPPHAEATTEFSLADEVLQPLRQRYDLLAELGRGGMGAVYRARDRETGDVVALKVLLPEIASRPELIERFKSELVLARKVTHKNVCRVYELNRFGAVAAISMEYVEGRSLRSLLGQVEGVSVHYGLRLLRQALAGLAEAHAQGVVHRDLKPENILLARDGTVKVMDFGVARSVETDSTVTGAGMLIGTPAYMSPEQAEGKPTDARSDIYAVGLLMYELFTGRPAFTGDTPVAYALKHIQEAPPPPRALEPDLPERLVRVMEKCVEKNPKKRFQSVEELEAALGEHYAPVAGPEEEPEPPGYLARWGRLDWVLVGLGLAGLLFFLSFRDTVFPASRYRLEVDAITARREAEALAERLGRPLPAHVRQHFVRVRQEFAADEYRQAAA